MSYTIRRVKAHGIGWIHQTLAPVSLENKNLADFFTATKIPFKFKSVAEAALFMKYVALNDRMGPIKNIWIQGPKGGRYDLYGQPIR